MGMKNKLPEVTPFSLRATARTPPSWAPLSLRSIGRCLHKLHRHQPSTVFQPINLRSLVFSVQAWFWVGYIFHSILLNDKCLLYYSLPIIFLCLIDQLLPSELCVVECSSIWRASVSKFRLLQWKMLNKVFSSIIITQGFCSSFFLLKINSLILIGG